MTTVPELVSELTHIVRDVTGCLTDGGASYSYGHHPGPLTQTKWTAFRTRRIHCL